MSLWCSGSKNKQKQQCEIRWQADFQQTTRRHIPEDRTLHNYRCDNLKSYMLLYVCHFTQHSFSDIKAQYYGLRMRIANMLLNARSTSGVIIEKSMKWRLNLIKSESESVYDWRFTANQSWRQAPWDSRPVILFSNWTLTFIVLM
jgi:hypothetical protein